MKKNNLKVLSVAGASVIPFVIAPLIVSCSKSENKENIFYDEIHQMSFDRAGIIWDYNGNATKLEIPEYLESSKCGKVQVKKFAIELFIMHN